MKLRIQPRSIAFRLIVAVLSVELLSSVLVVVLSYGYERHIHFHAFDVMLHGRADSILGAVQDADDANDNVMLDQADLHVPPEDIYEVFDENGALLGRTANWKDAPDWKTDGGAPTTRPWGDFSVVSTNGHHYRMLRIQGSRTIDPGEKGGGKVHKVTVIYGSQTAHIWHIIHQAVQFYAIGSLALLLITGPLIGWLLHRALLPLHQLAALASQVSVNSWQFSPPASARTTPELAPLTHAIENVLQRLERSFTQQKTFVSDAAHELKTAVAVQKSSLQLLNMKRRTPQEYQAGLERCLADSLRLESLVADMLTLARAETTPTNSETPQTADLNDCIYQVVTQLETIAAVRNVHVAFSDPIPDAAPLNIAMPAEDCRLLVSNLLLNALQHSPAASTVEIRVTREPEKNPPVASLVLQDHGDGIPAEALPHVFDRFYRGDPSRARNTGGTGLGLAICKAIVQRARGAIGIASQPDPAQPGQGTTVTVLLPLAG
jgi:signal transduction histidine kinase